MRGAAPRGRRGRGRARRPTAPALTRFAATLLQNASDAMLLVEPGGALVDVNARAEEMYGYPRAALLGMPISALRESATLPALASQLEQARSGGVRFETIHRRADGSTFPVEVSSKAIAVRGASYLLSIVRDVTDRHAALRSERKFHAAFERAGFGILLLDAEGRVRDHNGALEALLGRSAASLRGARLRDLTAREDLPRAQRGLEALVRGDRDAYVEERRYVRADGTEVPALLRATALRDEAGRFEAALGIVEDLSVRRTLEAHVDVADRLAALGTMAGGLVHELSSPVAAVLSNVGFAVDALGRPDGDASEARRALMEALESVARVRELLREVRIFSRGARRRGAGGERVDAARVVRSVVALTDAELRPEARVVLELPPELPEVCASPSEVALVLIKLLVNAAEAVRGREDRQVTVSAAVQGERVALRVQDRGPGIAPDDLPRIFDPYFTTRPERRGLGLAVCRGVVEALGGELQVVSTRGEGTVFTVLLPAAGGSAADR